MVEKKDDIVIYRIAVKRDGRVLATMTSAVNEAGKICARIEHEWLENS